MLQLTPELCAGLYDALRVSPFFAQYKLPHADEVAFHIIKNPRVSATCCWHKGSASIEISENSCGTWHTLSWVVAHEMIHLVQSVRGTDSARSDHNAEFRRIARACCRHFCWDEKNFGYY